MEDKKKAVGLPQTTMTQEAMTSNMSRNQMQNHQHQHHSQKQQNPQVGMFQMKKFFGDIATAIKDGNGLNDDPWKPKQTKTHSPTPAPAPTPSSLSSSSKPLNVQSKIQNTIDEGSESKEKKEESDVDSDGDDDMKPLVEEPRTLLPPPPVSFQSKGSAAAAPSSPIVDVMPKNVISPSTTRPTSPSDVQHHGNEDHDCQENDWEVLSAVEDRASFGGSSFTPSMSGNSGAGGSGGVFVARAGSIRSITSVDQENSSHQTTLSIPFKIQRTNSSSTLDSHDHNFLGPSGKGVLGVDYVEHVVLPTDTLQGICIAYKVSASQLRRANHFSGTLVHSAPKKLVIPISKQALRTGFIRAQDTDTKEYKLHSFIAEFPNINPTEAKAYLELADWDLKDALRSAKEDREWENDSDDGNDDEVNDDMGQSDDEKMNDGSDDDGGHEKKDSSTTKKKKSSGRSFTLKSGQIGIRVGFNSAGLPILKTMKGTGASSAKKKSSSSSSSSLQNESKEILEKKKVKVHSHLPAIATKSVRPEDLVNAAPQSQMFGFELQELPKRQVD